MIVEDNPSNLKLIRDLVQMSGYTTLEAGDGKEGVEIARARKPDLILMDIEMPEMDGLQATRILKADIVTSGIRIIALTSYAMAGDEEMILGAGCDGYITKPIDTRGFHKKIGQYLSK